MPAETRRYWVGVLPENAARKAARAGRFSGGDADRAALDRLSPGDGAALLARRAETDGVPEIGRVVAIGRIGDAAATETDGATRPADWWPDAHEADAGPLVERVAVLREQAARRLPLDVGLFEATAADFRAIAAAMGVEDA